MYLRQEFGSSELVGWPLTCLIGLAYFPYWAYTAGDLFCGTVARQKGQIPQKWASLNEWYHKAFFGYILIGIEILLDSSKLPLRCFREPFLPPPEPRKGERTVQPKPHAAAPAASMADFPSLAVGGGGEGNCRAKQFHSKTCLIISDRTEQRPQDTAIPAAGRGGKRWAS